MSGPAHLKVLWPLVDSFGVFGLQGSRAWIDVALRYGRRMEWRHHVRVHQSRQKATQGRSAYRPLPLCLLANQSLSVPLSFTNIRQACMSSLVFSVTVPESAIPSHHHNQVGRSFVFGAAENKLVVFALAGRVAVVAAVLVFMQSASPSSPSPVCLHRWPTTLRPINSSSLVASTGRLLDREARLRPGTGTGTVWISLTRSRRPSGQSRRFVYHHRRGMGQTRRPMTDQSRGSGWRQASHRKMSPRDWFHKREGQFYQSDSTRPVSFFLAGISALSLNGIHLFSRTPQRPAAPVAGGGFVAVAIIGIVFSLICVGGAGVRVTQKGILIRNWIRRQFIPWNLIESFKFGSEINNLSIKEWFSAPMLQTYVILSDNTHKRMSGLGVTRLNTRKSREGVQEILDELDLARSEALGVVIATNSEHRPT